MADVNLPGDSDEFPGDMGKFLRELRENPDALGLMRSLCTIPDVRDLSYDERRARLAPDSIVQMILYDVIDDISLRDRFVETLMSDYVPPPSDPEDRESGPA